MDQRKFPCTGCGCCCKIINTLVGAANFLQLQRPDLDLSFPYGWDETGRCENLQEDNKCKVYESRPLICRVDEMGKAFGMTAKDNHEMTAKHCNKIMESFKIDKSLNVVL